MKTKKILLVTILATLVAGVTQVQAATTNLVQNVSFALTFYEQGTTNQNGNVTNVTVKQIKVTTKDIIGAVGTALAQNFSARAELVFVKDTESNNSTGFFEIRDNNNNVRVDISQFLSVSWQDTIHGSTSNSKTGIDTGVSYSLVHIVLANAGLTAGLDLRGFATITRVSIKDKNSTFGVDSIAADVSGTGVDTHGVSAIVNGSLDISGKTFTTE